MKKYDKYIDPVKMGHFISECRKEKKLTQEFIANEFGITSQSVSKWESGKTAPDITILIKLSELLGVEVHELLLGEKDISSNSIDKNSKINKTLESGVKFYEKESKKRYSKYLILVMTIFIIILFGFFGIYYVNNYNKINIYRFSNNEDLVLNGRIIFNPERKTILINHIYYNDIYADTDLEIKAKKVFVKLVNGDNTILNYECPQSNEKIQSLNAFLEKIYIDSTSSLSKDEFKLIKDDLDHLEFVISYVDSKDSNIELKFRLDCIEEFSNNLLFY